MPTPPKNVREGKNEKFTRLQIERAFKQAFVYMEDVVYQKTIAGKNGPFDVSQEDWECSQFSPEQIMELVNKYL